MAPLPLIVMAPSSLSVHLTPLPHVPPAASAAFACTSDVHAIISAITTVIKALKAFFILSIVFIPPYSFPVSFLK
jgi:hypothetical protein